MRAQICHITFSTIEALPPLLHEMKSLSDHGVDTIILGLRYDSTRKSCEEVYPFVHVYRLTLVMRLISSKQILILKLLRYIEFALRTIFFLLRHHARIIVAHDMTAMIPTFIAGWLTSKKIIYNAHELWSEMNDPSNPFPSMWNRLEKYFCSRVDRVIAPEENRSRILYEEYGAQLLPVTIFNVPPFIKYGAGSRVLEHVTSKKKEDGYRFILYQGLFDKSRCLEELIRAFSCLPEKLLLVLIGKGNEQYTAHLLMIIESLSLSMQVFIQERIPYDTLFACTCSADVGILLYRNNGRNNYYCAPNKLYEYLRAGLPLVASNFPGLTTMVEGDDIGICVEPDDSQSIASGIEYLLKDDEHYARMHQNAIRLAEEKYRWDYEFPKLLQLYNGILGERLSE